MTEKIRLTRKELYGATELTIHVIEQIPIPITNSEKLAMFLTLQREDVIENLRFTFE